MQRVKLTCTSLSANKPAEMYRIEFVMCIGVKSTAQLAYKISACEVCMICRKPTEACKNPLPNAESRTGKPAMVTLKI